MNKESIVTDSSHKIVLQISAKTKRKIRIYNPRAWRFVSALKTSSKAGPYAGGNRGGIEAPGGTISPKAGVAAYSGGTNNWLYGPPYVCTVLTGQLKVWVTSDRVKGLPSVSQPMRVFFCDHHSWTSSPEVFVVCVAVATASPTVERFNRTLETMLTHFVSSNQRD